MLQRHLLVAVVMGVLTLVLQVAKKIVSVVATMGANVHVRVHVQVPPSNVNEKCRAYKSYTLNSLIFNQCL